MKIQTHSVTLRVSGLSELDEDRTDQLVSEICGALRPETRVIEVDLGQVRGIDSSGAGVLMALHSALNRTGAPFAWRVVNPAPAVRQFLELVRLHRLFEIFPPRFNRVAV